MRFAAPVRPMPVPERTFPFLDEDPCISTRAGNSFARRRYAHRQAWQPVAPVPKGATRCCGRGGCRPSEGHMSERVIVLGGGIAGLSGGFRLKEAGFDVTVLEADDHVGGRMSTVRQDGFILDTAAGWLGSKYVQMKQMAADAGATDLQKTSDVFGFVSGGRIHTVRSHNLLDLA